MLISFSLQHGLHSVISGRMIFHMRGNASRTTNDTQLLTLTGELLEPINFVIGQDREEIEMQPLRQWGNRV